MESNKIPCDDPLVSMGLYVTSAISMVNYFSTTERENNLSNKLILKAQVRLSRGLPRQHWQRIHLPRQEPQETWVQFPRGGNGNPLQYSCWDNPMDRGAWQAFPGQQKSQMLLSTQSICKTDSLCCTVEPNTILQISYNKEKEKFHKDTK